MRKIFQAILFTSLLVSCNQVDSAKKELAIPQPPPSPGAAKTAIKNKKYNVEEVGTLDLLNEYDWTTASDTSKFYSDYIAERKAFALSFANDSVVTVTDEKKNFAATYDLQKDTGCALLLDIHYLDSSFSFNPGEATMMTLSYKIHGLNNQYLLLETPRELNRRKVVLLMKAK